MERDVAVERGVTDRRDEARARAETWRTAGRDGRAGPGATAEQGGRERRQGDVTRDVTRKPGVRPGRAFSRTPMRWPRDDGGPAACTSDLHEKRTCPAPRPHTPPGASAIVAQPPPAVARDGGVRADRLGPEPGRRAGGGGAACAGTASGNHGDRRMRGNDRALRPCCRAMQARSRRGVKGAFSCRWRAGHGHVWHRTRTAATPPHPRGGSRRGDLAGRGRRLGLAVGGRGDGEHVHAPQQTLRE